MPGLSSDTRPAWARVDRSFGELIRSAATVMSSPAAEHVTSAALHAAKLQRELDGYIRSFGLDPEKVAECLHEADAETQFAAAFKLVRK